MPVPCARCSMPLPKWELLKADTASCPSCGSSNTVHLFPAALADAAAVRSEAALEGEANCFDHPGKRAVAACQQCGRFVCGLCEVEFGSGVWCPSCVASTGGRTKHVNSASSRMLYDTWALFIPLALMVIWPLTILSAPAVIALAFMKWNQPISLVRHNRWRFVVGLVLAVAQGVAWIWFIWYLVVKVRAGT